ncbi:unnamed protein product [Allacma fusca]|nr:unnamed protein product [Allacma fusca]
METRLKLEDLENVSYVEVSTLRSWDLIHSRASEGQQIKPESSKIVLIGLEELAAAQEVEIAMTSDGANTMNFTIDNEEKKRIYLINMFKNWHTIKCQMTNMEGETLLMYVCRTMSIACFTRTR